jgi:superoxide dismutase, Cu-Zn family
MKKTFPFINGKFAFFCAGLVAALFLTACNSNTGEKTSESAEEPKTSASVIAEAAIEPTKDDTAVNGTARFTQNADGKVVLDLDVTISKMANDTVAVHIHEHGDCGDAGKNTHGHWNPTNKPHGKWGVGEFHSGDIGNIVLDGSGKGSIKVDTDLWSVGGDVTKDVIGKAIIVHSGVDDYTSQPAGNAGSRIGCGLIQKK